MRKDIFRKELVFGIIMLFVGTSVIQIQPTVKADLTDGLIGYWNFDEGIGSVAHDSSGHGNDGAISGATWTTGKYESALEITDTDYVGNIPASFDDSIITAFTVTAWIKWYGPPSYPYNCYIFDGRSQNFIAPGFLFFIERISGQLCLRLEDATVLPWIRSISAIPIGSWIHVAAVFDDTSDLCLMYINGNLDSTTTVTVPYKQSNHQAMIGNNHWAPSDGQWAPLNGIEDDLRIYNRVLSDAEIKQLAGVQPDIVYVDDDYTSATPGWGYDHFDIIQDGINAVTEHGTVDVYNGMYNKNVVINKIINLLGENKELTIIDATGFEDAVYITADWVNISNFTITYAADEGIWLDYCNFSSISNMIFTQNAHHAIWITFSDYNQIKSNVITDNYDSIDMQDSINNVVESNIIIDNYYRGMTISASDFNSFKNNIMISNGLYCMYFGSESNNNLIYNNFFNSSDYGVRFELASANNIIYNNYFNNSNNYFDDGNNIWNISKTPGTNIIGGPYLGGNFWGDYTGIDTDGDRLGDTVVPYGPGDYHPLVYKTSIPPVADADGPYTCELGETIIFDGSGSYDPDGDIVSYEWDFNDGTTGIGINPTHKYSNYGTYTVTLTVIDDDGLTDTDVSNVYINKVNAPIILLKYPLGSEVLKGTVTIEWYALDTEDGYNLPISIYYKNEISSTWSSFSGSPYSNTGECAWDTTTLSDGTYELLIQAVDSDNNIGADSSDWFQIKNIEPSHNEPLKPSTPSGSTNGKIKQQYSYTTSTTDPNGDQVLYFWDWGDGSNSGWLGPYNSGEICKANHTWITKNNYNIKVVARDSTGLESDWSDPLPITMPYSYKPIHQFLERLFQRFPNAFPLLRHLMGY